MVSKVLPSVILQAKVYGQCMMLQSGTIFYNKPYTSKIETQYCVLDISALKQNDKYICLSAFLITSAMLQFH